jgi:transcription termination/antitermination protein NusA|tara:strand:- start:11308 stop:12669 length:1362 start_codon:yes stop_codon:yes gene_type:complete
MTTNSTITGNKEILLVAETIAREKGISTNDVVEAMEEGIKIAAKKKYGINLDIDCKIDRKIGKISLYNKLEIIEKEDEDFNYRTQISINQAQKDNSDLKIGDHVIQELPPIDLSRVVAQVARNEIIRKVREAEKAKEYSAFKDRAGDIVSACVKKIGLKNIVMDVEGYEAVIHENALILKENFKVGDRVRCYIEEVRQEPNGAQIFLSRTHPNFLIKLFEQEVPELYEGNIEVKSVARDPGSRSKIAIYSRREDIDMIGSFIGIRGSRVQSVSNELKGEKIDIIKWSPNIAEYIINSLTPAKINKVVVDEDNRVIEIVVAEDQLSLAIGRSGQNVKLASKLVDYKIDIMTDEQESSKRSAEFNQASNIFIDALDVEEMIANLLAAEGFMNVNDINNAEISEISSIEGFDDDVASEIKRRAAEYIDSKIKKKKKEKEKDKEKVGKIDENSTENS